MSTPNEMGWAAARKRSGGAGPPSSWATFGGFAQTDLTV
jgi:hypothetical protein